MQLEKKGKSDMGNESMTNESLTRYKLAIFDLDGTILNTLEDLTDSTNHALESLDLPTRSIDEVRRFVGNGIRLLIERAVPAETAEAIKDKVFAEFKAYYKEHSAVKTKPYDGIAELFAELRTSGCLVAVLSNKADFAVQDLCKDYFPGLIDYAAGEKEGIRRKPAPDAVLAILEKYQVAPEDAVYIGDSEVDVETAVNAGVSGISVTWGFRSKEWLAEHGAINSADSVDELKNLLFRM